MMSNVCMSMHVFIASSINEHHQSRLLMDLSSSSDRINGVIAGLQGDFPTNLSSIIWLNGWSQAYEYFNATSGLGVGFNQMGCENFQYLGMFSPYLLQIEGVVLNAKDGSMMSVKLISELGVIGVLLVAYLLITSIKAILSLRNGMKRYQR